MNAPLFTPLDRRMTVTIRQLAELAGIPMTTVREWARTGKIPGAFRPHKGARWRFRREAIERWWEHMNEGNGDT